MTVSHNLHDTDRTCARCSQDAQPGSRFCEGHGQLLTDGGETVEEDVSEESDDQEEFPKLYIGDHVLDEDDDGDDDEKPTMVVVGLPLEKASEKTIKGKTVAEWNPDYPEDDDVIEVIYTSRTDVNITSQTRYAFPRSRMQLEKPVHDDDGDADENADEQEVSA